MAVSGAGVLHVHRDDRNLNALLEMSTRNGTEMVMAQRYLPAARQGDKRLIVLDGEPLAWCRGHGQSLSWFGRT